MRCFSLLEMLHWYLIIKSVPVQSVLDLEMIWFIALSSIVIYIIKTIVPPMRNNVTNSKNDTVMIFSPHQAYINNRHDSGLEITGRDQGSIYRTAHCCIHAQILLNDKTLNQIYRRFCLIWTQTLERWTGIKWKTVLSQVKLEFFLGGKILITP